MEVFCEYENVLDTLVECIYCGCDEEEKEMLHEFILAIGNDIEISTMISSKSRVSIKNRADFEVLDLVGDGFYRNMKLTLYDIVDLLDGDEEQGIRLNFVSNALHVGYYIRTTEESMYKIDALQEEKNRIIEDYEFVKSNPKKDAFLGRMEAYKQIFLPN